MAKLKWDSMPKSLGWNKLKSLRKSQGLSQQQVAVGAGCSLSSVYFIEMGYEQRTTEGLRKKLADYFQVDVDDLFPAEMIGNEPREKVLRKIKQGEGHLVVK
jgi:transcriptional regulator with XRE-family HTH domain